jgi:hypothetical protein
MAVMQFNAAVFRWEGFMDYTGLLGCDARQEGISESENGLLC